MELSEAIKTRRTIRRYKHERIPEEDIEKILDAGRYAPSPENLQMWRYVVIRSDQKMKNLIGELSAELARKIFGGQPYELTQGRLWYLPVSLRPRQFEGMRDGSFFLYPKYADTIIIGCTSESFNDSFISYPIYLFGAVAVSMAMLQMWLVAHSMGYGAGWSTLSITDPRHKIMICERLGIPRSWEPIGVLCLGVPKKKRMLGPSRFPLEGVVYSERWGNPYKRIAFKKEEK